MGFPNQWLFKAGGTGSSTASGSSGVNYVSAIFAGDTLSGINTYNDGASATPTDGTGGVVSGLTTALNSTTPLIGGSSLRFSKDGSNRQGEGWSYDFQLDRQSYEQSNPIYIQFYYRTSANFASSDMRVFVYDKDSSTLLTVQDISNNSGNILAATGDAQFTGVFYSTSGNNDYRLIWHIASTNANAYDVDLDNITVSPTTSQPGAIVSEWVSYTPTGAWSTNTTYTGKWRRVGDSMECQVNIALAGAPDNTALTVNLPSGFTIDTAKILGTPTAASNPVFGQVNFVDNGVALYQGAVVYQSTTAVYCYAMGSAGSYVNSAAITSSVPFSYGNTDSVNMWFKVPIANWAASAALSSTEVLYSTVKARYTSAAGANLTNSIAVIDFATKDYDPFSAVTTGASWKFTAPKAGKFRVQAKVSVTYDPSADATLRMYIYKNGSAVSNTNTAVPNAGGSQIWGGLIVDTIDMVKGDYIDIRASLNTTQAMDSSASEVNVSIEEVPDFSVFSMFNTVDRSYTLTCTGPSGWATLNAQGLPYLTADGKWRLRFNLSGSMNGVTQPTLSFTGVTFTPNGYQAISGHDINSASNFTRYARADAATNNLVFLFGLGSSHMLASGDVELAGKPTIVP